MIGQRRIAERLLTVGGFCGTTARKPISNIRIDNFGEAQKPNSPFRQLIYLSALWILLQVLQVAATA